MSQRKVRKNSFRSLFFSLAARIAPLCFYSRIIGKCEIMRKLKCKIKIAQRSYTYQPFLPCSSQKSRFYTKNVGQFRFIARLFCDVFARQKAMYYSTEMFRFRALQERILFLNLHYDSWILNWSRCERFLELTLYLVNVRCRMRENGNLIKLFYDKMCVMMSIKFQ